jgi:hypothetical protein
MTFTEFLLAAEPALTRYVENFSMTPSFPAAAHEKLKKAQRKYVLTGGFSLLSLPLYLVEALPKVLDEIREQASCTARNRAANLQP